AEPGRALGRLTDIGWGTTLRSLLADASPDEPVTGQLTDAMVKVLAAWGWERRPGAVITLPSRRRPAPVTSPGPQLRAHRRPPPPRPPPFAPKRGPRPGRPQQCPAAQVAVAGAYRAGGPLRRDRPPPGRPGPAHRRPRRDRRAPDRRGQAPSRGWRPR